MSTPIIFDRYGRMQYHPDYHPNQGKPWTTTDEQYLIEFYEVEGPEQMSLSLGRTIHTVMTRAYQLRKRGVMTKPKVQKNFPRLMKPRNEL